MLLIIRFTIGMVTFRFEKVYLTHCVSWLLLYTTHFSIMIPLHSSMHNSTSRYTSNPDVLLQQIITSTRLLLILTSRQLLHYNLQAYLQLLVSIHLLRLDSLHTCWCYTTYSCGTNCFSSIIRL
jgi:hypothetical protein